MITIIVSIVIVIIITIFIIVLIVFIVIIVIIFIIFYCYLFILGVSCHLKKGTAVQLLSTSHWKGAPEWAT